MEVPGGVAERRVKARDEAGDDGAEPTGEVGGEGLDRDGAGLAGAALMLQPKPLTELRPAPGRSALPFPAGLADSRTSARSASPPPAIGRGYFPALSNQWRHSFSRSR